jgi:hypothetical protein
MEPLPQNVRSLAEEAALESPHSPTALPSFSASCWLAAADNASELRAQSTACTGPDHDLGSLRSGILSVWLCQSDYRSTARSSCAFVILDRPSMPLFLAS